jgi:hypothetical protein
LIFPGGVLLIDFGFNRRFRRLTQIFNGDGFFTAVLFFGYVTWG